MLNVQVDVLFVTKQENVLNAVIIIIKHQMETVLDVMNHVANAKEIQTIALLVDQDIISMVKNVDHAIQIVKNALEQEIFAQNAMMVNTLMTENSV